MGEAELLRDLADKLDRLEAVTLFPEEMQDPGAVTVAWTEGRDHPGYRSLSQAIATLVGAHWTALRSEVVRQHKTEVATAREALGKVQEKGQFAKAARAAISADEPLRKAVEQSRRLRGADEQIDSLQPLRLKSI